MSQSLPNPHHFLSDSQSDLSVESIRCTFSVPRISTRSGKANVYLTEVIIGHWEISFWGHWGSDSWYYGQCPGMSVLFSVVLPCWVSLESQWSDWKDPQSAHCSTRGYHDVGLTMGMVSVFPFNSFFSLLLARRRIGFINTYGFKERKSSLRPSCLKLCFKVWLRHHKEVIQ